MQYILLVAEQIAVLFILVAIGILAAKKGVIDKNGTALLTNLALFFATPCAIIKAFFSISLTPDLLADFGLTALFTAAVTTLGLLVSYPLFKKYPREQSSVLRIAVAFPNCGFIGIPLASELLGPESVAYLSIYIVVFNLFVWTAGVRLYQPKMKFSAKTLLLNPGVIGLIGGTLTLLYRHELPVLVSSPITLLSNLNTPLAMLVLGFYSADFSFKLDKEIIPVSLVIAARQIIVPVTAILASWLMGLRGLWLLTAMVACVAPSALNAVMFAQKFDGDTRLAAKVITYSNIACIVTMSFLLGLSISLWG